METSEITISLEQYRRLIQAETKAEQYKNFLIDNSSSNNKMKSALEMIECESYPNLVIKKEKIKKEE